MRAPYDQWFGSAPFDATYGYDEAALLGVGAPDEPAGFADFWQTLYQQAREIDTAPELRRVLSVDEGPQRGGDGAGRVGTGGASAGTADTGGAGSGNTGYDVSFTSLDGVRINGWVCLPTDGVVEQAVVVGHGYGGRSQPDLESLPPHSAAIFPVARGLPTRGLLPGVASTGAGHVLHGIESRSTYIHGGCAADVWCAASALLALLPAPPPRLGYLGGSFGGGIGALALPWDERFTAAVLYVPSFGNHPLRLTLPCTGSGEAVREYAREHPEVVETLRFFDAAIAARRLRIPTLLGPALWDPAVPPPGQFAVYNAVPEPKELFVFNAGHAEYPGQTEEFSRFLKLARAQLSAAR